jgi:hypothetical protein
VSKAAGSNYTGLRLTLTEVPGRGYALVSLQGKRSARHWDDWTSVFPAWRVSTTGIKSADEALRVMAEAIHGELDQRPTYYR